VEFHTKDLTPAKILLFFTIYEKSKMPAADFTDAADFSIKLKCKFAGFDCPMDNSPPD
jgi:hypothetical protein